MREVVGDGICRRRGDDRLRRFARVDRSGFLHAAPPRLIRVKTSSARAGQTAIS
jgi:hypothetical protein